MQIIKKEFKKVTKLKLQTLDDLYNLKQILEAGDIISAKTLRTLSTTDKKEKRGVFLKISAEKIKFDENGQSLRITGKIVEGPEDVEKGYHTIAIAPNDVVGIEKEWKGYQKLRLEKSLYYKGAKILICVLDEKEASFGIASDLGLKQIATMRNKAGGKLYESKDSSQFYKEINDFLKEHLMRIEKIIIASPGFVKENLYKKLDDEIKKNCILENCSVTGLTGLNEVIKRGALERILKGSMLSKETSLVERFLGELGKDSKMVAYGVKEVNKAAEAGAIDTLLVSDKLLRNEDTEKLIETVEKNRGFVYIVNSTHESGEKLFNLGGLAAFLRYKI